MRNTFSASNPIVVKNLAVWNAAVMELPNRVRVPVENLRINARYDLRNPIIGSVSSHVVKKAYENVLAEYDRGLYDGNAYDEHAEKYVGLLRVRVDEETVAQVMMSTWRVNDDTYLQIQGIISSLSRNVVGVESTLLQFLKGSLLPNHRLFVVPIPHNRKWIDTLIKNNSIEAPWIFTEKISWDPLFTKRQYDIVPLLSPDQAGTPL